MFELATKKLVLAIFLTPIYHLHVPENFQHIFNQLLPCGEYVAIIEEFH